LPELEGCGINEAVESLDEGATSPEVSGASKFQKGE